MEGYKEDTAWKTVGPRRKGKRGSRKNRLGADQKKNVEKSISYTKEEYETVIFDKVMCEKKSILDTPFWEKIVQILKGLRRIDVTKTIVAYGMGSFETKNAIVQMGCLLNLADYLRERSTSASITVEVFDPVMNELDIGLVEKLGFTCIKENENCKRVAPEPTLFYMPHGDIFMYGNLIEKNHTMETIENVILFGNGLTSYIENQSRLGSGLAFQNHKEETKLALNFICKIKDILIEQIVHKHHLVTPKQKVSHELRNEEGSVSKIQNSYQQGISLDGKLERAFNDTSICTFVQPNRK